MEKLFASWQFFEAYDVLDYGSGWRKDVVNQCLEFGGGCHCSVSSVFLLQPKPWGSPSAGWKDSSLVSPSHIHTVVHTTVVHPQLPPCNPQPCTPNFGLYKIYRLCLSSAWDKREGVIAVVHSSVYYERKVDSRLNSWSPEVAIWSLLVARSADCCVTCAPFQVD